MIWVIIQKFLTGFLMGKKAVPGLGLQAEVGEWCPEESEGLKGNQRAYSHWESKKECRLGK